MRTERDIAYFADVRYEEGLAEGRKKGHEEGREEGLAAGLEEGRKEEKLSLAKSFKALGVSIEQIAQATGLSEKEVQSL